MRRVLITGLQGWIGDAVCRRMGEFPEEYDVKCVSVFGDAWEHETWAGVDSVVHLAGIPGDGATEDEYRLSNVELTERVGRKCLADGVPHLVFMSTAHVYGSGTDISGPITLETEPNPSTPYGRSKFEAEQRLRSIDDRSLKVAVIRPPLVYGPGCMRGNFPKLVRLAARTPVFPYVRNIRSMIYLGSLAELVRLLVDSAADGTYLPQDLEWICTSELVCRLGEAQGNHIRLSKTMGTVLQPFVKHVRVLGKLFGCNYYAKEASTCGGLSYVIADIQDAIRECVREDA